ELVRFDRRHRHRLNDEVGRAHRLGVGVDGGRLLDAHLEPLETEEREEELGRLHRPVAIPPAADDEGPTGHERATVVMRAPSAALASTAARIRCTSSASAKDGVGCSPAPIAATRSATWWVNACS